MRHEAPDDFVSVARVEDVPPGTCIDVELGDDVILIANAEGAFYAMSAWCPHQGTALALGKLNGRRLTCWAHLWTFDVESGEPIWPPIARVAPGYALRVYPVRVVDGELLVSLGPSL